MVRLSMTMRPTAAGSGTPRHQGASSDAGSTQVAAVVAKIAALAEGNCASRSDVELLAGDAHTRSVRLVLRVQLAWTQTGQFHRGVHTVDGSEQCTSAVEAQRLLKQVCGRACQDPAISERVAGQLARSGVAALDAYRDGCDLGALPFRVHHLETCRVCSGAGRMACTNPGCARGNVSCIHCGQTGEQRCHQCFGAGSVSEAGRVYNCPRCNGRGRAGPCAACLGSGWTKCTTCAGSTEVGCTVCNLTGQNTQAYSTRLQGRVTSSLGFDEDAPPGFQRACRAVTPMAALAQTTGSLVRADSRPAPGQATLTLHCRVQHVEADMACKLERIHVDALGPGQEIPIMPTFLDGLSCLLVDDIKTSSKSYPAGALRLATQSRLTRGILTQVGEGRKTIPEAVSRRWSGAVSTHHVELISTSLRDAYSRAGRSPVRRTWLVLSPLIALGSLLANAYQEPMWLLREVVARFPDPSAAFQIVAVTGAETLTVLPIVLLAWLAASRTGRRHLRTGLGGLAKRGPPQGRWPLLGFALALLVGWTALATRLDAAPMGLPWAPAARPGGRSVGETIGLISGPQRVAVPARALPSAPSNGPAPRRETERAHRP